MRTLRRFTPTCSGLESRIPPADLTGLYASADTAPPANDPNPQPGNGDPPADPPTDPPTGPGGPA